MPKKLPRLVIVSGTSGSGKSSIARDLAKALGVPLLAKDDLKEALFDTLGNPKDPEEEIRLGTATYVVIERIGTRLLEAGIGLVVEGNFWRGRAEANLGPLVARSRPSIIHCEIAPKAMAKRLRKRVNGEKARHPGHAHPDPKLLEDPQKLVESRADLDPPAIEAPIRRLNTTADHNPQVGKLVRWVKRVTR